MYKCLNKKDFKDQDGYQLITIRQEDVELIRLWRNAQMDILRQKVEISPEEQQNYFQKVIIPTFSEEQPKQILFSFLLHDECIGYGGGTNIDWDSRRAEVSFLVNPARAANLDCYAQDFTHFLDLLCQVAFEELHLHRLFTETFSFRVEHMYILEKFGFQREGILREHIYKRHQWDDSVMHGLLSGEWRHGK
jgi:RimJ/RimL family protein N-acetyltransferase